MPSVWASWMLCPFANGPNLTFPFVAWFNRACLKVSGYEVIGRARGDLGAKFAANVRVYIWDALSSVTFFPFRNPLSRPWSMFKAPGLLLVSRKITLMFFFCLFFFFFFNPKRLFTVLGWPLGMSALGSYKLSVRPGALLLRTQNYVSISLNLAVLGSHSARINGAKCNTQSANNEGTNQQR